MFHVSRFMIHGFTLTEIILVVAMIVILASFTVPIYQNFQIKNDLNITVTTLAQTLRRAQVFSRAGEGDSSWGVKVISGNITLFKGQSYAVRDLNYDEVYNVPPSLSFSGIDEVVFSKLNGEANQSGDFSITSSAGDIKNINLNPKGIVSY